MEQALEAVRQTNFTALDWVIVAIYLAGSVAIGLYVRKYIANMADYVVAGRGLRTALGVATMTGTEMGLVTVMYNAQKGFNVGFAAFHIGLVAAVVTFFVGLSGFIVYRLREMEVMTIPEFYEKRFGPRTRILGGIMLALGGILNMGMFLKAGSMFVVGITGLDQEGWALTAVMSILLALVLVYTVLGGMVSVVITDYVQFVVLSLGFLLACGLAIGRLGWGNIFRAVAEHRGEAGFNPFVEGGGFGVEYVVWMCFLGLVSCAIWQTAVMRALAAESKEVVRRQYMWSSVSFLIRVMLPCFLGICAFVFVMGDTGLEEAFFPEAKDEALSSLYAMPVFLGRILPIGIIGVITAAMLAAFMSTHDSYLLCWSSVITQDVVAPLVARAGGKLDTKRRIALTRVLIVVVGVFLLFWGLMYPLGQDLWDYLAVSGAIYFTGAFALLLFGLYWKRASSAGAVAALVCGLSALVGLKPVQGVLGFEKGISSARVGLGTVCLTLVVMVAGSLLFPDREKAEGSPSEGAA